MKIIRKWCFVLKKMKNVIQKNIKALIVICLAISMFVGYNVFFRNNAVDALSKYGSRGQEVKTIQKKLKRWGYYSGSVDGIYGSGTLSAVKKFQNTEPGYYDVICMDIMMPNLNGWDAARKIRTMKRADAEKIPIIAMSANAFTEDIIKSRISGMDQHVAKPLDMNQLRNVLKECVKKHT